MPSGDIRTAGDITRLIAGQPQMMDILSAVSSLNLQDCWVGAGFVRFQHGIAARLFERANNIGRVIAAGHKATRVV